MVVANPAPIGAGARVVPEPHVPAPRVAVAGDSPIARALVELAAPLGFRARLAADAERGDFAAVIASLGHGDEEAVRRGSRDRVRVRGARVSRAVSGAAVLDPLRAAGVPDESLARAHARRYRDRRAHAREIALAILAELVAIRSARRGHPGGAGLAEPRRTPWGGDTPALPVRARRSIRCAA